MATSVANFNPFMSREEAESYLNEYIPRYTSKTIGGRTKHFSLELFPEEEEGNFPIPRNVYLLKMMELEKEQGEPVRGREPLAFRFALGPKLRDKPYSSVAIQSTTGSPYVSMVLQEIYQKKEQAKAALGDIKFRENPLETMLDYGVGSFFVERHRATSMRGKFAYLLSHGAEEQELAGGVMTVAEHLLTEYGFYSTAQRVTHAFGHEVRNRPEALRRIASYINPETFVDEAVMLAGKVPYRDADGVVRWREASQTKPEPEGAEYHFGVYGGARGINKLNVSRGERESLNLTFRRINPVTGLLETAYPEPITDKGQRGLRMLNVAMGATERPTAMVVPNTYMVPSTPDSGAMTLYDEDLRAEQELVGPFFPTRDIQDLFFSKREYFAVRDQLKFRWGIMQPEKYEEGGEEKVRYTKVADLPGYTLEKGQRAIIGTKSIYDPEVGEWREEPIPFHSQSRITTFRDYPTLVLPGFYDKETQRFSAFPGINPETDVELGSGIAERIPEEDRARFAKAMGQGYVDYSSVTGISLSIPIGEEQFMTLKMGGVKETISPEYGIAGQTPTQRTVRTMGGEVPVSAITGEVKDPLVQFLTGTLGTMQEEQLTGLMSDLFPGRTAAPMQSYIRDIFAEQERVKGLGLPPEELNKQFPRVLIDELAEIYSKTQGTKISGVGFLEQMYRNFNLLARTSPEYVLGEYKYGLVDEPQYFDYRQIDKGWQPLIERTLDVAISQLEAPIEKGGLGRQLTEEQRARAQTHYRFEDIPGTDKTMWQIMRAGRWGMHAGSVVTEHLNRGLPGLGIETFTSLETDYPYLAKAITGGQPNLLTPGQKAWRTIGDWYSAQSSERTMGGASLPPGFAGEDYTPISEEQANRIWGRLFKAPYRQDNPQGWQEIIQEVVGEETQLQDILRMEFGESRPSIPSPAVMGAAGEYSFGTAGERIDQSAIMYRYKDALMELLGGGSYNIAGSSPSKLFDTIAQVQETSAARLKELQRSVAWGAGGKFGALGGQLPPGYSLMTKSTMRQELIAMARGLDYPGFRRGRVNERLINRAFEEIRKTGYLEQFISSDPSYKKADAMLPTLSVYPELAREKLGINIPKEMTVEAGKVQYGGMGLFGAAFMAAYKVLGIGKDFDADEARQIIASELPLYNALNKWQKTMYNIRRASRNQPLVIPGEDFYGKAQQTGVALAQAQEEAIANMTDRPMGGGFNPLVGETSEILETLLQPGALQEWMEETKFDPRVTQTQIMREAGATREGQGSMGREFQFRRWLESARAASGQFSAQSIAEMYGNVGTGYLRALEGAKADQMEKGLLPQLVGSIHPFAKEGEYGIGMLIEDASGENKYFKSQGFNFGSEQLYSILSRFAQIDVEAGFLTEKGALSYFSRTDEERQRLFGRLEAGESLSDILSGTGTKSSLARTEGYDFSQSDLGTAIRGIFQSKLRGINSLPYNLPEFSDYPNQNALSVFSNYPMIIGGEEYKVGEPPLQDLATAYLQSYQVRTKGPITLEQRATIEEQALALEAQGKPITPVLQHIRRTLNTAKSRQIMQMADAVNTAVRTGFGDIPYVPEEPSYMQEMSQREHEEYIRQLTTPEEEEGDYEGWQKAGPSGGGGGGTTNPPTTFAMPEPEEPSGSGRRPRPRARAYSGPGGRAESPVVRNLRGTGGEMGFRDWTIVTPYREVLKALTGAAGGQGQAGGEETLGGWLQSVQKEKGLKALAEVFGRQEEATSRGWGWTPKEDRYQDMLIANYNKGVAALEEYEANIRQLEQFGVKSAAKYYQTLTEKGSTPRLTLTEAGFINAKGEVVRTGEAGAVLGAQLKEEYPGIYEDINKEDLSYAKQMMDVHKRLHQASVSAGRIAPGIMNTDKLQEIEKALTSGRFEGVAQVTSSVREKPLATKDLADVLEKTKQSFYDMNQVVKNMPDNMKKFDETLTKAEASMSSFSEENQNVIANLKAQVSRWKADIAVAQEVVSKTPERIMDEALTARQQGTIAREGWAAANTIVGRSLQIGRAEEALDRVVNPPTAAQQFGRGLRGVFGGWGLMYLSRVGRMGMNIWEGQYGAAEQYQMAAIQAGRRVWGGGFGEGLLTPLAYAQQGAQIRGGGGAYRGFAELRTGIDEYSGITGPLMGGLGGTLAASYMLPHFFPSLAGAAGAATLGPISLAIGGAAMIGYTALNYAQERKDPQSAINRAVAQQAMGKNLAAATTLMPFTWGFANPKNQGLMTTVAEGREQGLNRVQRIMSGDMKVNELNRLSQDEVFNLAQQIGMVTTGEWGQVSASSKLTALINLSQSTVDPNASVKDIILQSALDIEAGGVARQVATNLLGLTGTAPGGNLEVYAAELQELPQLTQEKIGYGAELMAQTPGIYQQLAGTSFTQRQQLALQYQKVRGGPYEAAFLGMASAREQARQLGFNVPTTDITQYYKPGEAIGGGPTPETYAQEWTPEDWDRYNQEALKWNRIGTLSTALSNFGITGEVNRRFAGTFGESAAGYTYANRLLSFSPTAIGQEAQANLLAGNLARARQLSQFAITDVNLQGQQTGLGLWTTSMGQGIVPGWEVANQVWGAGNWQGTAAGQAAVYGINRATGQVYGSQQEAMAAQAGGANVVGGYFALQQQQYWQGANYRRQQMGIQWEQLALRQRYQPLFWEMEDRQRELGYRQQEWGFQQQEERLVMQSRQFQENQALQMKQAFMQRQFTREDWGYQDLTRGLQWGWRQEDFAENVRFMTGRERRLAERQMERETTMFNLETGQIDKQRDRQQQLWALEDERFALQKEHYAEQLEMQEEALAKQREFFEERKKLEEESVALNRQYQEEQIALQEKSLAIQQEYMEASLDLEKKMLDFGQAREEVEAAFNLAKEEQVTLMNTLIEGWDHVGVEFKRMVQSIIEGTPYNPNWFTGDADEGGGGGGGGGSAMLRQEGGDMFAGASYVVGEKDWEVARTSSIGSVVNKYDIAQALNQEDKWDSQSVFFPTRRRENERTGPQTLNVYVGNERLASFVIDSVKKELDIF